MPGSEFDRLRAEVPMQQVLQLLGVEPKRCHGDQSYGRCPFRDRLPRRRPCFSVNAAIGRYYCHRCRRHGHQLDLWAAASALMLYPAVIHLCDALGRNVPWIRRQ